MKKIKISLILFSAMLIFASGMLLTSCQKEDELLLSNKKADLLKTTTSQFNVFQKKFGDEISNNNGILKFQDRQTLNEAITYTQNLENADNFLQELENYYGFVSLQTTIDKEVDRWLEENEDLDLNNSLNDYNMQASLRLFANQYGEFQIPDTIFHIKKDGSAYIVENEDYSVLEKVRANSVSESDNIKNLTVISMPENIGKGCSGYSGNKIAYMYYSNNNKRIKGRIWFAWSPLVMGTIFHGEMWAYKKVNGKWKRDETEWMRVIVHADYYNSNCNYLGHESTSAAFSNRHHISADGGDVPWKKVKTKSREFYGRFDWGAIGNYQTRYIYY